MRFDLLRKDLEQFAKSFPSENYDVYANASQQKDPTELEGFLCDGWNAGTKSKLNFFEALCYLRFDGIVTYETIQKTNINEHDILLTGHGMAFAEWTCDPIGRFDVERYASGIYNIPIRIIKELNSCSQNKDRQAAFVNALLDEWEQRNEE